MAWHSSLFHSFIHSITGLLYGTIHFSVVLFSRLYRAYNVLGFIISSLLAHIFPLSREIFSFFRNKIDSEVISFLSSLFPTFFFAPTFPFNFFILHSRMVLLENELSFNVHHKPRFAWTWYTTLHLKCIQMSSVQCNTTHLLDFFIEFHWAQFADQYHHVNKIR